MEENKNIEISTSDTGRPGEKAPGSFRLILTLGIAGFFSGLIMAGAYLYTKPMIDANKAAAIERAIFKVLPGCTSFKTLELKNGKLTEFKPQENKQSVKGELPKLTYMGYNNFNEVVGFAILGDEIGFADVIAVMMGYDAGKKTIIGFEVLESKETPGLGDKIFKDQAFKNNFVELLTEPEILFAKKGEKHNANEVEAITGATISSKAIIRLLNNSMKEWKEPINNFIQVSENKNTEKK